MFGGKGSPQEVLIKNHVEYGGNASELWKFRWANGELVFPPAEHTHANARRQSNLKSKARGAQWEVPELTKDMLNQFQSNDVMLSLLLNIKENKSNPAPPIMSTHKSRRSRADDGDDDSVDMSFTNATAEKATSTSAFSKKKSKKTKGMGLEELTTAIAEINLEDKDKKQLFQAVYDLVELGDVKRIEKYLLDSGKFFFVRVGCIQLALGAYQPMIPNMFLSESSRQSDDGLETHRSLFIKICIGHPLDAKHVSSLILCCKHVMFFKSWHSPIHTPVHSFFSVWYHPR